MSGKSEPAFFAIVLLAIALRVAAIVYTHATAAAPEENRLIAAKLAAGRGFTFTEFGVTGPTAIRGPVYPMLLAIVGPDRIGLILAINVLAGAATVLAAPSLTCRLLSSLPVSLGRSREGIFSTSIVPSTADPLPEYRARGPEFSPQPSSPPMPRAAWIAAVLFAVWPTQLYAAALTQGLSIAVFLTVAALNLAWQRTPLALIAAGLLAGLAALTEPVLALPLLLAAIVLGRRRHWPNAVLFVATAMVLIAPWLYRNAVIFGGPIPITSNFWRDAYLANGPESVGFHWGGQETNIRDRENGQRAIKLARLTPDRFDKLKTPEPSRVSVFKAWTLPWIRSHPFAYLNRCINRAGDTLGLFKGYAVGRPPSDAAVFSWSRGLAASMPLLLWFYTAFFRVTSSPLLHVSITMMVGLVLSSAFSMAVARNGVLMDIPQFLATAAFVSRMAQKPKSLSGLGELIIGRKHRND